MGEYCDKLTDAMNMLVAEDPRTVFIGQAVVYPGTAMFHSLANVPASRKIEMPVAEDMQMGIAIGMALDGMIPVCIYPRFNFLLLAINQLVLHLDKIPLYSTYKPRVIIRTAVATPEPMFPGPQHLGDFTTAMNFMTETLTVRSLLDPDHIMVAYERALKHPGATLLIERAGLYAGG